MEETHRELVYVGDWCCLLMYGGTHRKFGLLGCLLVYGGTHNQVWVTGLFTGVWRNPQGSVGDWAVYWCMEEPTGKCG